MGEAKGRREATRSEKRAAILNRRFGATAFDLHIFPLSAIKPSESPADLPLAAWMLQVGLETLERMKHDDLHCVVCDEHIALDLPPAVGFLKPDDPNSELVGFAVCEMCFRAAETPPEELTEMVGGAFGGVAAPVSRSS
jgi:hypothetical protein